MAECSRVGKNSSLDGDNVINTPSVKCGSSMRRAQSPAWSHLLSQKRRRVTRNSVDTGAEDFSDKSQPLDPAQRPNVQTILAGFIRREEDNEGRVHESEDPDNTISNDRIERRAKDEDDDVSTTDGYPSITIRPPQLNSDIKKHASTRSTASAKARRTPGRRVTNVARDLTNPFLAAVSSDWNLMSDLDRRVYSLQCGVPMGGNAIPHKWSEIVQILLREDYFTHKQFLKWSSEKELQNRYEQTRFAVQGKCADREPKYQRAWQKFRGEDVDICNHEGSQTSGVHQEICPLHLDPPDFLRIRQTKCQNDGMPMNAGIGSTCAGNSESGDVPDPNLLCKIGPSYSLLAHTDGSEQRSPAQHNGETTVTSFLNRKSKDLAMDDLSAMDVVNESDKRIACSEDAIGRKQWDIEALASVATTQYRKLVKDEREEPQATNEDDETPTSMRGSTESPDSGSYGYSTNLGTKCCSTAFPTEGASQKSAFPRTLSSSKTEKYNDGIERVSVESDQYANSLGLITNRASRRRQPAQIHFHEDEPGATPRACRFRLRGSLDPEESKENREVDSGSNLATIGSPESLGSPVAANRLMYAQGRFESRSSAVSSPRSYRTSSPLTPPGSRSRRISSRSSDRRRTLFGPFAASASDSSLPRAIVIDAAYSGNVLGPIPLVSRTERPTTVDTAVAVD